MINQSPSRREFLKIASMGTAAYAMGCESTEKSIQHKNKPNVMFIAVDDLNDWIDCLGGHPDVQTPNMNRLASRGVLFTNAHCAAPACGPSRAAVMSGIRPSTSGVYNNAQPFRMSEVLKDAVMLPQHFKAHGYTTLGSGKIYHGIHPDPPSWDDYWPSKVQTRPVDPMPENPPINGIPNTQHFDWGPIDVENKAMGDSKVANWVISQLGKKHDNQQNLARILMFCTNNFKVSVSESRIGVFAIKGFNREPNLYLVSLAIVLLNQRI